MSGKKAASGTAGIIAKILKPPWSHTGPTASPEFLESLVPAGNYRPVAPTNVPPPIVPTAEEDRIYDIKYFTRDHRRTGLQSTSGTVSLAALKAAASEMELPPLPSPYYTSGDEFALDDTPGDGYQK